MENNKIRAFKGFNKNMMCRDFQYKEGGKYTHSGHVAPCESGFHACENPVDCFSYYSPGQSVFHEVELDGDIARHDSDSKIAASRISIGARLDIPHICRAAFEYVKSKCTNEYNAAPGKPATAGNSGAATAGYRGAATAGDYGAATAGYRGAATAGDYGAATAGNSGAATAGYRGAATAGYRGAATAGNYGAATAGYRGAATAGDYGAATAGNYGAATAGYRGAATAGYRGAATAGDYGAATSRGTSSSGENGISVARGNGVKVRGGKGALLIVAEELPGSHDITSWKAVVVDDVTIKADTWYQLVDNELVECDD